MKNKLHQLLLILTILATICLAKAPLAQAQWNPFTNLYFCPFAYYPLFLPPPVSSTAPLTAAGRYAHVPLTSTTSSLFPAPTLPTTPAATVAGVGVTTLIPTVPVAVTVPASALVTTPLAPLITYTPLSLVGLTYAPVPVVTAPAPVPLVATVSPTTIASVLSALLI
ncbi:MAG: hypothetical protein AB1847_00345 [bacterium]